MDIPDISSTVEEFRVLSEEYKSLQSLHQQYTAKSTELAELQAKCLKGLSHQKYRIGILKKALNKTSVKDDISKEKEDNLKKDMLRRKAQLTEMEQALPKESGLYLKIILGNVNVSILNKDEKFKYKEEYEKFKLILSSICMALSLINLFTSYRVFDLVYMFLLVWYYCTLTIRESILKVNGSRIKGWWRTHHFISTVLAGVLLIWTNNEVYYTFRNQFVYFSVYINFVQYLQFQYQRGCLYRLKALGERNSMDITIEGFHSWMWKGLSFLLPFLFIGYAYELYNAYTLYHFTWHPEATWQVPVIGVLFFALFLGNTLTTSAIIPEKLRERGLLKYRFTRLDKYLWTHTPKERKIVAPSKSTEEKIINGGTETIMTNNTDDKKDK